MKVKVKSKVIPKDEPFDLFEPIVEEKKKEVVKPKRVFKQSILSKVVNIVIGDFMNYFNLNKKKPSVDYITDDVMELFE